MFRIIFFICALLSFANAQQFLKADSSDSYARFYVPNIKSFEDSIKKKENLVLEFEKKFGENFNPKKVYPKILSGNIDVLEMDLFDQIAAQNTFLEKNKEILGDYLFKKLSQEVTFNYWHYIYAYPILRGNANQNIKRVSALPQVFIKSFPAASLKNNELLHCKSFRNFLYYYISYQNSKGRGFEKYNNLLESASDKSDFAIINLSKELKDYALSEILLKHQEALKIGTAKSLVSQIDHNEMRDYFSGEFLDKVLKNEELAKLKKEEEEAKKNGDLDLTDLTGVKFGFEKYKGKVIYVDFWASWCGPCRAEFPHSKNMKSGLSVEEAKKIVFLNISIDDSKDAWKEAIKSLGIDDFEHGHSAGGWSSKVVAKFQIRGIPRYMIIDKTGKIIKLNATRPSAPETIDELRLLAK